MTRVRVYAQLVRLPNVFTALADIVLRALVATDAFAGPLPSRWWLSFPLLLAASACLYCGGMVWNDFFDLEQDRRERPFRPLPSGRVSRAAAARLGTILLAAGLACACFAGWREGGWRRTSCGIAVLLAASILLYDGWLKRTWAGPLGMGLCRFLNVLLGLSVADNLPWTAGLHLALIVGLYIVGVTWFARTEARASKQSSLGAAAAVMLVSLVLALAVPVVFPHTETSPLFPYLLVALGFLVGIPVCEAIARPVPTTVQPAVKRAIMGLVLLDAVLATAVVGTVGLVILVLLPPALFLGRWVYST